MERIAFQPGETYKNRKGAYEVLKVSGDAITVRYLDDGTTVTLSARIQETIVANVRQEAEVPQKTANHAAADTPSTSTDAYFDIETTGLSPEHNEITVVGMYLDNGANMHLVQLVGQHITRNAILSALKGVATIFTYNGHNFDLPFVHSQLGLNLKAQFGHRDLMYDCQRCNLYGGLKAVERELGISRRLTDINGYKAVLLWKRYTVRGDRSALDLLLAYNEEDVRNLRILRRRLDRLDTGSGPGSTHRL